MSPLDIFHIDRQYLWPFESPNLPINTKSVWRYLFIILAQLVLFYLIGGAFLITVGLVPGEHELVNNGLLFGEEVLEFGFHVFGFKGGTRFSIADG